MNSKIISFGSIEGNALTISIKGQPDAWLTHAEIALAGNEIAVKNIMRSRMSEAVFAEYHPHKNRDGSWCHAIGEEPSVWPEDYV